jgi:hypothetical protein
MAHHRGLAVTLVVALVAAVVFVGVMELATNDTDEPVADDIAAGSGPTFFAGSSSLLAAPSRDDWSLANSYTNFGPLGIDEFQIRPNECGAKVVSSPTDVPRGTARAVFHIVVPSACDPDQKLEVAGSASATGYPPVTLLLSGPAHSWLEGGNIDCTARNGSTATCRTAPPDRRFILLLARPP